jgi:hypothetical protein
MSMDWDQCDNCGKLGPAADLNEDGLCPTCAADDAVPRRIEEELLQIESLVSMSDTPAPCMICGKRPASYRCDSCGQSVCSQCATVYLGADGAINLVTCVDCFDHGGEYD